MFENRLIFNPLNLRFYHEYENIKDIGGELRKRGTRSYVYPEIKIVEIHVSTYPDVIGFLCAGLICHHFIRDYVEERTVKVIFFCSEENMSSTFTNNLSDGPFKLLTSR